MEYQDGSPATGIVVELNSNPEAILNAGPAWKEKQNIVARTTTDKRGRFKFPKVPSGKYEVRVNLDLRTGSNQTSVIVRVRRFWFWPLGRSLRIRYTSFI